MHVYFSEWGDRIGRIPKNYGNKIQAERKRGEKKEQEQRQEVGLSPLNPDLLAVCRWRLPPSLRRQEGRFSPRVRHVPSHHPRNGDRRCVCLLNPDLLAVCGWRLPPSLRAEEGRCSPRERGLEESTRIKPNKL